MQQKSIAPRPSIFARALSTLRRRLGRLVDGARGDAAEPDEGSPLKGSLSDVLKRVRSTGFVPRTVIDVGVATGTAGLYTTFPEAHFLMVEPIEEYRPALDRLAAAYRADYVLAAAGPQDGEISIRVFGGLSGSSIVPPRAEGFSPAGKTLRTVPMIALDSLQRRFDVDDPLLMKLDVQGAELMALDGAPELLARAELVVLETSLFRFHGPHMPDFWDVVSYMKARGFVVYDIIGGYTRALDGALGQVDLVFVKEDGALRSSHNWG